MAPEQEQNQVQLEMEMVQNVEKQGDVTKMETPVSEVTKMEMDSCEEDPSPRAVLEKSVSGSDSDQGNSFSSSLDVKLPENNEDEFASALSSPLPSPGSSNNNINNNININIQSVVQLKSMFDNIKKRSVKRLSSVSLMNYYEQSRKSLRWKLGRSHASEDCIDWMVPKPSWRNFTYQELESATKKFRADKMIGKGGHAEVYKGKLPDGQIVAVKKIIKKDKKDEDRVGEFLSELGIIAHINHPNAAKLVGFGIDNGLYLILQFAPNGSLGSLLHGDSTESLDWELRFKVAVGIADGLKYLHSDCQRRIVHRDITASNILLSEDYEPQISDFGLAKWLPENWNQHVVSPIEGTFGYMAPEYFMHGIVHEKTDVFAYGVLLLELITGRRAVDSSKQSLVKWAKPFLEKNDVKELVDPRLGDNYDIADMNSAILTALLCVQHSPDERPSMSQVVQLLRGENKPVDTTQNSNRGKEFTNDSDIQDYNNSTTYLKDLDRHKELVME